MGNNVVQFMRLINSLKIDDSDSIDNTYEREIT